MLGFVRLVHSLTQWILMTPAHPEAFGTGCLLFQSAETPSSTRTVISHQKRKGERVGGGHDGEGRAKTMRRRPTQT